MILDPAVAGNHLRQPLDPSGKPEKSIIANKETSVSYNSPNKPICSLMQSPATAGSRMIGLDLAVVSAHQDTILIHLANRKKASLPIKQLRSLAILHMNKQVRSSNHAQSPDLEF
ncbi:MAG: hypothetical protein HQL86_03765 [Magnetococcales bacterium]|nr:hypothetical protein [Magnetococcales bacterium]